MFLMKKFLILTILSLVLSGVTLAQMSVNQQMEAKAKAEQADIDSKTAFPIKRGEMSGKAKKVKLAKILAAPEKYSGQNVLVEGVLVRSCKVEGCWFELAPNKDGKTIRIKMKDHGFFIPLNSGNQNLKVKAEGVFKVKTLSKAEVDHLIEDGGKFSNINPDGTVTEVSFLASGLELRKATK
jgi:uncharacterized protein YdeI (BOF family)